jgi:hypothetical protein
MAGVRISGREEGVGSQSLKDGTHVSASVANSAAGRLTLTGRSARHGDVVFRGQSL